jgi:hypothetical protein
MSDFDIAAAWEPYTHLLSLRDLAGLLQRPVTFMEEALVGIIPSIVMAPDGVKLRAIFLVTRSFLSEVSVNGATFDVLDIRRVAIMRWFFGKATVQAATLDAPELVYDTATLRLEHKVGAPEFATQMSFVGERSDDWVAEVRRVLPCNLVTYGLA